VKGPNFFKVFTNLLAVVSCIRGKNEEEKTVQRGKTPEELEPRPLEDSAGKAYSIEEAQASAGA